MVTVPLAGRKIIFSGKLFQKRAYFSDTDANLTHWIGSVNSYLGTCKRYDTYRFREQLVKRFKKDPIVVFNIEKGNSTSKKDLAVFVASFHLKSEKHPLCCFTIWNCVVMWLPD